MLDAHEWLDMNTPRPTQPPEDAQFVEPSLRPSPEQPSRPRVYIGVALLLLGSAGILFGDVGLGAQLLFIAGAVLIVLGMFLVGRFHHIPSKTDDARKLYGHGEI